MADALRVLYVDDEPGLLGIGKLFLEKEGEFTVDTLTSVIEALAHLDTERYDAIISDYQMPEMDGIAFLKQLKASGNTTPFIIFTGKGREEVVIEALNEGADFYLQKGGEPKAQFAELANKIRYAVSRRNAELDLRESEDRYRHVVEDQTEFICRFLPDGTHIFVNEAYCRYFGMTRDKITGTRFRPAIHPEDQEQVARHLASLTMNQPLVTIDQRVIMPDGSTRWQRWVDRAIFFPDGSLKEYQSVGRDITDWKQAEDEIKTARETYQNIFLNSQIGLFRTDVRTGLLLDANDAVAQFMGYPDRASLLATPFNIVERYADPDDHDRITALLRSAGEFHNYEARFKKNDGSITWMRFSGRLVPEKGWVEGVSEDISERKMADMALHDSELKYRSLIESSSDAIFCVDQNGVYKFTNHVFASTFNKTPNYFIGKSFWDIYPREHADYRQLTNSKVFETGETQTLEVEVPLPDTTLYFIAKANPIKDETGKVILNLTHATDITERKVAEEALRESEERHRILLNDFPDPIFSFYPDGTYRHANQAFATGIGKSLDQIIGKKIWDVFQKDEADERFSALRTVFSTGEGREIEVRVPHPDGDRIYLTTIIPVKDVSGSVVSVICSSKDITERKVAEKALQESEEKYRGIFDESVAAVYVFDNKKNFINSNQAGLDLLGYSREELLHMSIPDVDADPAVVLPAHQELLSGGRLINYEHSLRRKDETIITVINNSSPLTDLQGNVVGMISTLIDITEHKKAEVTLQRQSVTLSILNALITTSNKADDLPRLLNNILDESLRLLDFDAGGIYLVDRSTRTANVFHSRNLPPEFLTEIQTVPIDTKPYDTLFINNEPIITDNYAQIAPDRAKKFGFQSMASIPLLSKGVAVGALNIASLKRQVITGEEKQTLTSIGRELGSTIERVTAEEEAKKAQENLETLFDSIDEMVFVLDMKGRILVVNDAVLKRLLYTPGELAGMDVLLLHVPERRDEALSNVQGMIAGTICSCPVPVLAKDGTRIEVETKVTRGRWNDQEVLIGVSRDITERKRAEEALRESEEQYRGIFENALVGIFQTAPDGRIINANEAAARMFGYADPAEICSAGLNVSRDLYANPDDRKNAVDHLQKTGYIEIDELRVQKRDKSTFWASAAVRAVRDPDGSISCFEGFIVDISKRKQAEEALRESDLLFREVFNNANDAVFLLERTQQGPGTYILVNDKAVQMLGYSRQELMEMSPGDIVPEDIAKKIMPSVMKKLQKEGHATFESVHRRKDGSTYPIEVSTHTFRYKGKDVDLSIVRDITERRMVDDALRESHNRFALTLASLNDAILMVDPVTRIISECNDATTRIFGYSREELIGRQTNILHVDQAHVEQFGREANATYDVPGYFTRIFEMRRKDGSVFPTEHFVRPIRDSTGRVLYVVSVVRDITGRQQAEEALRASEERYRNVVEDLTEFICRFLPDGTHLFVNDAYCRYFNKKREELIGHRFRPELHPEDREIIARNLASITPDHPVMDNDQRIIMPDGNIRWQRWNDRGIFDPNGRLIEYQSVGRDITEQKELEKEREYHEQELMRFSTSLASANKKLTLLSGITRHDINNQLTVLVGYIAILEKKQHDPALTGYFQKVITAAERISAMIRFTKEYEEIGVNAPAWQDCRTLVDTAATHAPLGNVLVKNDLPAGHEVFADQLIGKVFYNLMDNAVRYGGMITAIRFSAWKSAGNCTIFCEDDGEGIPVLEKEKIFDPGFGKNTGLGLALSREILDITGITIHETGEPGKGARFEITVPKGMWRQTESILESRTDKEGK